MSTFAGQYGPQTFTDKRGNAQPSVTVTVYEADGTTLASLYTDRTKATALANPLPTGVGLGAPGIDALSNGIFYAEAGQYHLKATRGTSVLWEGPVAIPDDAADAGPPLPHAASHAHGGSDEVTLDLAQTTGLVAALAAKATPADITTVVDAHSADTTAVHGIADTSALILASDARLSDARTPTAHAATHTHGGSDELSLTQAQIVGLVAALAAKATPADITTAVNALVAGSPGLLDTLKEIADALGDDPNFAATMTTALAGKQPLSAELTSLAGQASTATGRAIMVASNAAAVRTILALGTAAQSATGDFDASGAAAAAQAAAVQRANHTGTQAQSTITGLVAALALLAPVASPAFTGVVAAPALSVSGLTGAVAASRYAGGMVSGPPTTGTFALGDWIVDQSGIIWICTTAGSPGTWKDASSSGKELAYIESPTVLPTITTVQDLPGVVLPNFTVRSRPVYVEVETGFTYPVTSTAVALLTITDSANAVQGSGYKSLLSTSITGDRVRAKCRVTTPGTYSGWKARLARANGTGTITNGLDASTPTIMVATER